MAPLAVATAVVGAGVAPGSPASAVTCCGDLVITYRSDLPASAPYLVEVYGRTSGRYYSPADYRAEVRLWGEDTFSDDLLKGPMAPLAFNGTEVYAEFAVSGSTLNEDWRYSRRDLCRHPHRQPQHREGDGGHRDDPCGTGGTD